MSHLLRLALAACLAGLFAGISVAAEQVSFKGAQLWPAPNAIAVTGTLSKPKGSAPFAAVVLLPNCGGPKRPEFATFWPAYLNQLGYATLNVDGFSPRGKKRCSKKYKPGMKDMVQDAYGALGFLANMPDIDAKRVAVLGSSLGAHIIHRMAGLGKTTAQGLNFASAISLYPSQCKKVSAGSLAIRTLIIQGDREKGAGSCRRLGGRPELEVVILPGTHHAFDQLDATPLKGGKLREDVAGNKRLYSKSATEKAQALVKGFLAARLAAASTRETAQEKPVPGPETRLPKIAGKDPYMAVSRRDKDGDEKVSAAEWDKSPGVFAKIDADGDGFITPQEFHDHWQRLQ